MSYPGTKFHNQVQNFISVYKISYHETKIIPMYTDLKYGKPVVGNRTQYSAHFSEESVVK
jgi:hypothetical protein